VTRVVSWAVALVLAVLFVIVAAVAGVASLFGGSFGGACAGVLTAPDATPGGLTAEQVSNAAVIVRTGASMSVPVRGWVIAIATALQESNLINLGDRVDRNDHDSLGLFQQRPSQGWGTPAQVTDPVSASRAFYTRLVAVPDWSTLPLTVAAQRVQRSAYPDAYAKHEARATAIVAAYTGGTLATCDGTVAASGWVRPVAGIPTSGFRTADRPNHDGIDIAAPKGTVIHAASAGTVVTVLCNVDGSSQPPNGGPSPCDHDGGLNVSGCGWHVEIRHPGATTTRYCHMLTAPAVRVGQIVTAGQPIGAVGTSGNSSGPHLHFEVHTGYPANSGNAINPQPFLINHGVTL
jgi:murein DD-endopeptidase MepM/ murein hydrolase activator NlpD